MEKFSQDKIEREDQKHDFMRRQTVAAEALATADRVVAWGALISAIISVATLFVTAWPHIQWWTGFRGL